MASTRAPFTRRAVWLAGGVAVAGLIAAVLTLTPKGGPTTPAPAASSPSPAPGTSEVIGDAQRVQRELIANGQPWEFAMGGLLQGDPTTSSGGPSRTREQTHSLRVVIASEHVPTLRAFIAAGHDGEQRYCAELVERIRALGYRRLEQVLVDVFFGEADLHAQFLWSASAAPRYTVLDGDVLTNSLSMPRPGASPLPSVTPFPAVPSPQ